jgi:hypothetical protein
MKEAPKGIEVLVKKAAVDPAFKTALLERRAAAAQEIGLDLKPAEAAMIEAVPAAQLSAIIGGTTVPVQCQRAFLGGAAATMLAAMGAMSAAFGADSPTNQWPSSPAANPVPNPSPKPDSKETRALNAFDRRLNEVSNQIVSIKKQIADTQSKVETSPNDRQQLLDEVHRLKNIKAELAQQCSGLRVLKSEVEALKEQMSGSVRIRLEMSAIAGIRFDTPPPPVNPTNQ